MGVVRREGDWRLTKQRAGVYEVTHQKQPVLKVLTSDYTPDGLFDERNDFSTEVAEVDSYSDAEALFERVVAEKSSTDGFASPSLSGTGTLNTSVERETEDLPDLPPGGVLLVGFVGGGYLVLQSGFVFDSILFVFGVGLLVVGLVVIALAYRTYDSEGLDATVEFLLSTDDESAAATQPNSENGAVKTPPAPESLKNELYFERAARQCEYCDTNVDSPDVHHIMPREEGGPNEPRNLIVLCPNCHRKADRGVISRSKLRYQINRS